MATQADAVQVTKDLSTKMDAIITFIQTLKDKQDVLSPELDAAITELQSKIDGITTV